MAALSKELRDRLPKEDFAVPGKRKLPIHDKQHIVLAWNASRDLEGDERYQAQRAILRRADHLGVDTKSWHLKDMVVSIEAFALDFGQAANEEHCNKFPFTGVLTFLDEPSDNPVGGTGGKRVIITSNAAEQALHSLIGMAVDFTPDFDGHEPTRKIGLITGADIEGNEVKIAGYFWAADYPEEVALIRRDAGKLGFSYECRSVIKDPSADPLVVAALQFTGAAVLYKDKAAYMKTSLAARADHHPQETKMEKDLQDALTAMSTAIAGLPKAVGEAVATQLAASANADKETKLTAAKSQVGVLTASASTLRTQGLESAAQALDLQIAHMNSFIAKGEVPPPYVAGTTHAHQQQNATGTDKAIQDITKVVGDMATAVAALTVKVEAGKGGKETQPNRKTLSAAGTALLSKTGIKLEGDGKLKVVDLDAACEKAKLPSHESMALKLALQQADLIEV